MACQWPEAIAHASLARGVGHCNSGNCSVKTDRQSGSRKHGIWVRGGARAVERVTRTISHTRTTDIGFLDPTFFEITEGLCKSYDCPPLTTAKEEYGLVPRSIPQGVNALDSPGKQACYLA